MNKIKDTVLTMCWATRYSFAFCWRNSKRETVWRLAVSVFNTIILYFMIQATGHVINAVQASRASGKSINGLGSVLVPFILLIVVLFAQTISGRCEWFFRSKWGRMLRFANQRELNDQRARLDVARFGSKTYDDISKRILELNWGWQTRPVFAEEMFRIFTTLVSFILFGVSLLWYKPEYALILLITAIPMTIIDFSMMAHWWNLQERMVAHNKFRNMLEKSYFGAIAFVQALMFNQLPFLREEIKKYNDETQRAYDEISRMYVQKEMLGHFFCTVGLCAVFGHAIWDTLIHGSPLGTLTVIMAAARTFNGNLETIVALIAEQWNSAKGVILIERDFLGMNPVLRTENPIVPSWTHAPVIRFDRVNFRYPDTDKSVLHDVSFLIQPGSKVAIVGRSGSSKSTIAALLMRHYDPTSGAVYAGDINLQNIEPLEWNKSASALMQDYVVHERTLETEIASSRLGQPINLDSVMASTSFSHFDEVVAREDCGYTTQIGKDFGGREFSGGERQRLALARVKYRETPILILDEPDAKLDPESAEKVIDNMFALDSVTVVMITHHVSRARRCDHVIVMEHGRIAEQGTHEHLMSLCGIYASMFQKDEERLSVMSD